MGIVEKIKGLVQSGDIKNALDELSSWAEVHDESLHNTTILLLSRYNNLKRKTNMGLISDAEAERNQNRLAFSIISTLEDIDEPNVAPVAPAPVQQPAPPAPAPVVSDPDPDPPAATGPKKIFISYARKDREWVEKLQIHLVSLQRQGLVDSWDDSRIKPGDQWDEGIMEVLEQADIYIFMISANFLASDFINQREVPAALAREEQYDHISVIPVIVRPCNWTSEQYSRFQALPANATPISTYNDEDQALLEVVEGIASIVK
ncbi:MAG: TIR domain-containing protein [Bacteroidota bacterium]